MQGLWGGPSARGYSPGWVPACSGCYQAQGAGGAPGATAVLPSLMASRAFDSLGEKRPEFPLQFSFLTSAFLIVALMFWQSRALGPARWQWAAPSSHGDSRHPHLMYLHLRGVSESTFFGKKQKLSRMERTSWLPPPGSNRRVSAFFSLQLGMYTMGT